MQPISMSPTFDMVLSKSLASASARHFILEPWVSATFRDALTVQGKLTPALASSDPFTILPSALIQGLPPAISSDVSLFASLEPSLYSTVAYAVDSIASAVTNPPTDSTASPTDSRSASSLISNSSYVHDKNLFRSTDRKQSPNTGPKVKSQDIQRLHSIS